MARQNRRSGDIDFLSIAEGGSGVSDLSAFRNQYGFIAKDDPRVIKVLPGNSGAPELKIDSVADLSVIRPDLSGPSKINPGETIQFLIQNRDVSVNYEVSSSHGYVRQEDGIIYFTLTNNSSAINIATFSVNGFIYSVEVSSSGPLTGTVLLSAVKTYDSVILNIKATDFKSNDASVLSGIEYQVSSNYDFTDIVHTSKASGLNDKITIGITDTLYVRVRYITAIGTYGNWFYSDPIVTSELKNSVAKPYGVGAITTDSSAYTLLLKGSKFLSAIDLTLKSIEIEEYSDAVLSKLTNATSITTTSEDIQSVYTPSSTYVYIRFRYVDSMNNKSEWSNTIRLSVNGAYKTLPVAEVQKIVEPYPYAQGEFGFKTEISQDGKLMVVSSHFNNKNGAFYIFKRINDKWSMHQFITYPDTPGTSSAAFANALKITHDAKTIFVGARNAFSDMSGAVYVYAYDLASDSWVKRDTITNHDKIAQSGFGTGIIISKDGTKLIISDTFRGTLFSGKTRVDPRLYFYSYNGTAWTLDQTLSFTGGWTTTADRGSFGIEGAVNDTFDRLVFTAPRYNADQGILWNCVKTNGTWTILNSAQDSSIGYGDSLYANSDLSELIVGSGQTNGTVKGAGTIKFLSYNSATSKYTVTNPIISPPATGTGFGYKIAANTAMDTLLIGARLVNSSTGEVYLYKKINGAWIMVYVYLASDGKTGEEFGVSFTIDEVNKEILICANAWANQGIGSLYVHRPQIVEYTDRFIPKDGGNYEIINDFLAPAGASVGVSGVVFDNDTKILTRIIGNPDNNTADGTSHVAQFEKINGEWVKTAAIKQPDGYTAAGFGHVICHSPVTDIMMISQSANVNNVPFYVHCYKRNAQGIWGLFQTLSSVSDPTNNAFGFSAAVSEDGLTLAVGSLKGTNASLGTSGGRGSVHIYKWENSAWVYKQLLVPDIPEGINAAFGAAVDITSDGSRIAIGAWGFNDATAGIYGLSYVFVRQVDGSYIKESRLLPTNNTVKNDLGRFIKISRNGDRVFSAARNDNEFGTGSGALYVYRRDGTTWVLETKLTGPTPIEGDSYPSDFDISDDGDMVCAGARSRNGNKGVVWFHKRTGTNWSVVKTFSPSSLKPGDFLGTNAFGNSDLSLVFIQSIIGDTAYGSGQIYVVES